MTWRTVSAVIIAMLSTGTVIVAFNVQPVKSDYVWTEPIYINVDGSISPPTAPISSVDNVTYTLTDNIIGNVSSGISAIIIQRNNTIVDGVGHTIRGIQASGSWGINLSGNNITNKNMEITAFDYGIFLGSSSNNSVTGNNITANTDRGIGLYSSSNNNIVSGNNIAANNCGIQLSYSINNSINGNNITNNGLGIGLDSQSNNNSISGNNVIANNGTGIQLSYWASNNSVSGNDIAANKDDGIDIYGSFSNTVSGNNITNDDYGLALVDSFNNNVIDNNIANNSYSMEFGSSSISGIYHNNFYHNNFVDNTHPAYIYNSTGTNLLDDGYPSGGNYWSDYAGADLYSGPYQNQTGSDGIGDTPYVIDGNNQDNYPLMKPYPWGPHDVGVTYIARVYKLDMFHVCVFPPKTIGFVGISLHLDIFVMNYGDHSEVLNLTVLANSTAVAKFQTSLCRRKTRQSSTFDGIHLAVPRATTP